MARWENAQEVNWVNSTGRCNTSMMEVFTIAFATEIVGSVGLLVVMMPLLNGDFPNAVLCTSQYSNSWSCRCC